MLPVVTCQTRGTRPIPSQPAPLTPGCCGTLPRDGSHCRTHCASPLVPVMECARRPGRGTCCRWRADRGDSLPPSSSEDQCQKAGSALQPSAAAAAPSPKPQPVSGSWTGPHVSSHTACTAKGSASLPKNAVSMSMHPARGHSHSQTISQGGTFLFPKSLSGFESNFTESLE